MERTRWTDERIDDRMTAMDEKWDRQSEDLRGLRAEMHAGFAQVRAEMQTGFAQLQAQVVGVQRQMIWLLGAFAVGLLGLLGAFVATQL